MELLDFAADCMIVANLAIWSLIAVCYGIAKAFPMEEIDD